MSRFAVDPAQVERVQRTALKLFDQLSSSFSLGNSFRVMLGWAAELHEIGLGLSHDGYQQHSAYLVEASDMAGFSRQEQYFLAALVGFQRDEIPGNYAARLPGRLHDPLCISLLCIRLAWVFCRTREDVAIPDMNISRHGNRLDLKLPADWMLNHPLTIADLEYEEQALKKIGLQLSIAYVDHESGR